MQMIYDTGLLLFSAPRALPFASRKCSHARQPRLSVRASTEPGEKSLEGMRKFSEQYARRTNTYFCSDKSVTAVVVKGLAAHKDELGAPLCPCRHYDDKKAEVAQGFWNCPCVPMRERKECHCMLFLTEDNGFRGDDATISLDTIHETTKGISGVQD
ncbi:hypothetical protein WJX73_000587 [Symbiochloris irregularis]|uniref:Ferredoxin-thioredoxin reductase catalytic chain, chloroplastic n=1 Tax=Symbiochloris irregularis TaxID=706552 RepID=A0AAW1PVG8_9CHLO